MGASLEKKNNRLEWLDFGKAMGILMVLMVHAECRLGVVTFYGGMFYMPVFFVAAGYTYRRKAGESFGSFLKKKAKRLLIPYVGTSAFLWMFFWVKDSVFGGNPLDLKLHTILGILYSRNQMYAMGYHGENPVLMDVLNAPLWFLTAMFLTYVYYELICRSGKKYPVLITGLAASVLWHWSTDLLLPWSLDAVPYFACFMAAGEWLRKRAGIKNQGKQWKWILTALAVFLLSAHWNGSVNLSCGFYGKSMLVYLAAGITGSVLIFAAGAAVGKICPFVSRIFGWIGQETLPILCFHMFLFMFIRTGAGILGLGTGMTQILLVGGSTVLLTGIGKMKDH